MGACQFEYDALAGTIAVTVLPEAGVPHPPRTGVITTRWDAEALQCRIVVTLTSEATPVLEFPHHQLWKAVQVFLERFLFLAD